MKAYKQCLLLLLFAGSALGVQAQIQDTLIFLTSGLQPDRSVVQMSSLTGLRQQGTTITANDGYRFAAMSPSGRGGIRDSLLYLVPADFRGRNFSGAAVTTRNQKAAIFVMTCPNRGVQLSGNGRSLSPARGCRFSPYRRGMNLKGRYILVVPEY